MNLHTKKDLTRRGKKEQSFLLGFRKKDIFDRRTAISARARPDGEGRGQIARGAGTVRGTEGTVGGAVVRDTLCG